VLVGQSSRAEDASLTGLKDEQLAPLFQLAEQLQQGLQPVQPSASFVRSLGKELASSAAHQVILARRMRRGVLIGAAAVGSLVSIASIIGAIVLVVVRLRARAHARTSMG
jgi:hypothetical protein